MKKSIDGLTGLRGYAALWVMFGHAWGMITPLTEIPAPIKLLSSKIGFNIAPIFKGWAGVEIFFVLSGFLLFLPFAEKLLSPSKEIDLKQYFKRRFLRIFPAYYVQMAILGALAWWGVYENGNWLNWLMHILMIHNVTYASSGAINGVWWTLPVEFDFYLVLPLLFIFIRKTNILLFIAIALTTAISYRLMIFPFVSKEIFPYRWWLFGQLIARIDLFAYGMIGAFVYKKYLQGMQKHRELIGFCLSASGAIGIWSLLIMVSTIKGDAFWNGHPTLYIFDSALGLAVLLLVLGICLSGRFVRLIFSNKLAIYFGNISYGLYLWHMPILVTIFQNKNIIPHIKGVEHYGNIALLTSASVLLTIIVAHLSYRCVERPFMNMGSTHQDNILFRYALKLINATQPAQPQ